MAHEYNYTNIEVPDGSFIQLSGDTRLEHEGEYGQNLKVLEMLRDNLIKLAQSFKKPDEIINKLEKGSCKAEICCETLPTKILDETLNDFYIFLSKHKSRINRVSCHLDGVDIELYRDPTGEGWINFNDYITFNEFLKYYREKYSKMLVF